MRERSEGSLASLRRINRRRVINALRTHGMISRAEIARRTGLSRSTVSSLVAELQSDGLVVEREEQGEAHGEQGGRPPILLSFDASAGAALGLDFGHSHLRVAVADLSSTILAERAVRVRYAELPGDYDTITAWKPNSPSRRQDQSSGSDSPLAIAPAASAIAEIASWYRSVFSALAEDSFVARIASVVPPHSSAPSTPISSPVQCRGCEGTCGP